MDSDEWLNVSIPAIIVERLVVDGYLFIADVAPADAVAHDFFRRLALKACAQSLAAGSWQCRSCIAASKCQEVNAAPGILAVEVRKLG